MTEKLHQSLSSVMDGADDDLELPRLLSAMQASPELQQALGEKWRRYHLAQSVMKGELRDSHAAQVAGLDISAAVMQQLAQEENVFTDAGAASSLDGFVPDMDQQALRAASIQVAPAIARRSDRGQWFRGSALAASVALLVITGVQIFNTADEDAALPVAAIPATTTVDRVAFASPSFTTGQIAAFPSAQPVSFSSFSLSNPYVGSPRLQPCGAEREAFLPILNPQALQQVPAAR